MALPAGKGVHAFVRQALFASTLHHLLLPLPPARQAGGGLLNPQPRAGGKVLQTLTPPASPPLGTRGPVQSP